MCNPAGNRQRETQLWPLLWPILWLLMAGISPAMAQDAEEVRGRLGDIEAQMAELNRQLDRDRGALAELEAGLRALDGRIQDQARALGRVQAEIGDKDAELVALNDEREVLSQALATQREALGELLRNAYRNGRGERLRLLLSADDPDRIMRTLAYYEYIQQARQQQMTELMTQMERLTEVQQSISQARLELAALQQQQATALARSEQTRTERRQVQARLQQAIARSGREAEELAAQREQLEALLEAIEEALADIPVDAGAIQFSTLKGDLSWPVSGSLRHRFGQQRAGGQRWQGVLIEAAEGSEVRAVSSGRVVFSEWLRGHGLLIIVDHGEGYLSLYAHNQTLYAEVGEWIGRGQTIAAVGASGGRAQNGLYFELRKDGKAISPQSWFTRATPAAP